MKETIRARLLKVRARLEEVTVLLSEEDVAQDGESFRALTKEHVRIAPIGESFNAYLDIEKKIEAARDLLSDSELRELAIEEIDSNKELLSKLESELHQMLLPSDPDDHKNIYLEIRAGTGGDESGLFVGDLLRMYLKYAEKQRWKVEVMSESTTGLGGYKEVVIRLLGKDVYSKLKFESGGHRVQRVPETETQGRVHTSAVTVAILPEADRVEEVNLSNEDLRIDTYRASGAGGQHVNKTDSAVRITHLPSGIVVECQDDRSQHKNRAKAMAILAARIKDKRLSDQRADEAAKRKSLIGSGDRSERIRTYNFPQGRLTDHRINLTLYKLQGIMEGNLDDLFDALMTEHQSRLLTEMLV